MPEGDTIHKLAGYLGPRLEQRTVDRLRVADPTAVRRCTGRRVRSVFAHGKHLFIEFDNELMLRSHLGMYGSWHRYSEGETWQKPRRQASLELVTGNDVFVCFNAKEIELVTTPSVRERIITSRLGPDLVLEDTHVADAVARAREFLTGDTPLADVLLDQRVAAGIGNVYKSEVLFITGYLPLTALQVVDDEALQVCYVTAAELLRANLGGGRRVTRFENDRAGRLWVYGRGGLPCLRCDRPIDTARLGKDHRNTFWCANCQH
ncbi:MAG: DNA-formamidopyrimidine glycosylase family protein [Gammaproteobacteria bacterium]|nr:DNA-formamidopyrimidine glycosylase family protein [Gammaproteobacteria bacterium]